MNHLGSLIIGYLAGWDPLGWVHKMDWYQRMLRAEWFRPIRPYWLKYHLDWVIVGLVLLIIVLVIRSFARQARLKNIYRTKAKDPNRAAKEFLKMGRPLLAAEAYVEAGAQEKALKIYVQEDMPFMAAQIAERIGKVELAVDLYDQVQDHMSVIRVLQKAGELERAAEVHRRLGNLADAGQMYLEADQPRPAAALFEEARLYIKAAEILLEAGEDLEGAGCLLRAIDEHVSSFTREEAEYLEQGARILKRAGRLHDSARLLEAGGQPEAAAIRYLDAGEEENAARSFEAAGKLDRAADLYRATGNKKELARILEIMRRRGQSVDKRELAQVLQAAGLHDRAADSFEELGDVEAAVQASLDGDQPAQAAMRLVDRGRHAEAAALFMEAGDPAAAREQFLIAGDRLSAAEAAWQASLFFDAGAGFLELDDVARAIDALQQVTEKHHDYRMACSLLAQAFHRLGDIEMSRQAHLRACDGLEPDRENVEIFYQQAKFLELAGDASQRDLARKIYAKILAVKYEYKDVKQRHEALLSLDGDESDIPRLGKYFLLERIGRGGMAEVFKACTLPDKGPGRFVAVKRILPEFARDEKFVKMLVSEARIAAQLNHSNIARILDFGEIDGEYFIALEYISGATLHAVWNKTIRDRSLASIPLALYIGIQLCEGLDYAHRKTDLARAPLNIIHRDISPENVMISYSGEVKIIDFGIAKAANMASRSRSGVLKGKFAYMSPEQVRGLPFDQRVDIFSTGVVLFELLTGKRLFANQDDAATIENVRNAIVPQVSVVNPRIPEDLGKILGRALAKDAEDRYEHAGELAQELKRMLAADLSGFTRDNLATFMRRVFGEKMKAEHEKEVEQRRLLTRDTQVE